MCNVGRKGYLPFKTNWHLHFPNAQTGMPCITNFDTHWYPAMLKNAFKSVGEIPSFPDNMRLCHDQLFLMLQLLCSLIMMLCKRRTVLY